MSACSDVGFQLLTPPGRSAVATLAIAGPNADLVVDRLFIAVNRRRLGEQSVGRIVFGRWGDEEVVVCRRAVDQIEVHCHGGIAAAEAIADSLTNAGCHSAPWPEWIEAREIDSAAAAARSALANACTERTAAILLSQYHGAWQREVATIEELAASPDESQRQEASRRIAMLIGRANVGRHLTHPWQVVIAGRPNAGKSSLANALLGYERAIVFDAPGTTRDVVTAITAFDGWPVQLADTAGLHDAVEPIEIAGVSNAKAELANADLVVLVSDGSRPWNDIDASLAAQFEHAILVHNKADVATQMAKDTRGAGIWTSTVSGQGLAELCVAIAQRLLPNPPAEDEAVPITAGQLEQLLALQARLDQRFTRQTCQVKP
jgi:tRNA modification GTPase